MDLKLVGSEGADGIYLAQNTRYQYVNYPFGFIKGGE
jgi:hypothetical protein